MKRIFHALDTLYGLQSNPNNSEYVFSTENGAEEYSFNDILRFIPSDLFPKGHWSIRPDPTSRFLQLPIQESLIPLVLKIPNSYTVEAMFAVGKLAKPSVLPPEIAKTEKPNQRKKMSEIVSWDGKFGFK